MDSDTKNFILFILLSFAIIFSWSLFLAPKPKKPGPGQTAIPSPTSAQASAPAPEIVSGHTAGAGVGGIQAVPAPTAAPLPGAVPESAALPEKKVRVTNGVFEIEFSSRGAVPVSWKLLDYQDALYYPYEINLRWPPFEKKPAFESRPVDMVDPDLGPGLEPFRTEVRVGSLVIPEHAAWQVETDQTDQVEVLENSGPQTLSFHLTTPQGAVLTKTYTFRPRDYTVDLNLSISPGQPASLVQQTQVITRMSFLYESGSQLTSVNFTGPLCRTETKLYQEKADNLLKKGPVEQSEVSWAGFTDSYFLMALLTEPAYSLVWQARYSGPEDLKTNKKAAKELTGELRAVPTAEALAQGQLLQLHLFVGPKQEDILSKVGRNITSSIDYGMLGPVVQYLIKGLKLLYRFIPNYGICIILLTVILRMGMFPLTRRGQESMKEMQKLQPEMQKLREKYPNDRMKQQEEMAALYKKYKINPIGGCLPMLLQIPVFFAFYKALLISIELRHAPFFWWIQDLSGRDPLLIWPLLMGGTQILMQKMTPTTSMDPTQAKMMMLMPLVFIFLLLYFPSGLIVYWTFSNLVGIGQQIYVNRKQ